MPTTRHAQARRRGVRSPRGLFAGDTLKFTNQNGIIGSYDSGTGVLTLSGSASVANYQTALRSITFSSPSDNPTNFGSDPSRTITWQANDGALSSTAAASTVTITAVDDAPVVTAGATVGFTEQAHAPKSSCSVNADAPGRRRQHDAGQAPRCRISAASRPATR